MNIYDKAKELGEMIANSKELSDYKTAEDTIRNDDTSGMILTELDNLQNELMNAYDNKLEESEIEKIKENINNKLKIAKATSKLNNYFETSSKFSSMMKAINNIISFAITGEENCTSGGCNSCSCCK